MEKTLLVINLISNVIMTASGTVFFLLIYGNENSLVYKWKFLQHWSLKFGLASMVVGSLLGVLVNCQPPFHVVLLNAGLGAIFTWTSIFHWRLFRKHKVKKDGNQ
jgi:hypothetical protein